MAGKRRQPPLDNERTIEIDVVILSVTKLTTSIVTGVNIAAGSGVRK
jgi:hypothetical protein